MLMNTEIFGAIKLYDEKVAKFLENLIKALTTADGILDRRLRSEAVIDQAMYSFNAMYWAAHMPKLFERLQNDFNAMLETERLSISFVPGRNSQEEDIEIVKGRGRIVMLHYEALCYVDSTFDTPENREWAEHMAEVALIANDCADILEGHFEDLIQCRRNYVALSRFEYDIYTTWRDRREDLVEAAKSVLCGLELKDPPDPRLKMIKEAIHD